MGDPESGAQDTAAADVSPLDALIAEPRKGLREVKPEAEERGEAIPGAADAADAGAAAVTAEPEPEPVVEPAAEPAPASPAAETAEEADATDADQPPGKRAERKALRDLARVTRERDEYLEQLKRTRADYENYRKRILRQQTEHLERAAETLVEKLLPVLDTFNAALAHDEGFEQVYTSLMAALEKEGLTKIDPKGNPFDPNEADAVAHEHGDGGPVVSDVLRLGYRWKGRVLRPAMVRVRG